MQPIQEIMRVVSKDKICISYPVFHSNTHKKHTLWENLSKRKSSTQENEDKQKLKLALAPVCMLYNSF